MLVTQEYFDTLPKYETFKYRFSTLDGVTYTVHDPSTDLVLLTAKENDVNELDINNDLWSPGTLAAITVEWESWKLRPEYQMYHWNSEDIHFDDLYDILLSGAVMGMAAHRGENPDSQIPRILRCLNWLHSTDFYVAPSSTRYHDSNARGLLIHSLNVAMHAMNLMVAHPFIDQVHPSEVVFTALVHDWCKIGLYESFMRNVKDDKTGVWNQVESFRHVDDRYCCLGHGTSSMYIASKFFVFSMEVAEAIRWHMGAWQTADFERDELGQANRQHPLVLLTQFADQLSITNYAGGVEC